MRKTQNPATTFNLKALENLQWHKSHWEKQIWMKKLLNVGIKRGALQRMKKLCDSILIFAHSPHIHQLGRTKRFCLLSFSTRTRGDFQITLISLSHFSWFSFCPIFVAGFSNSNLHFEHKWLPGLIEGCVYWQIWEIK